MCLLSSVPYSYASSSDICYTSTIMSERKHVKIVAFVGLAGSGKSSAVEYVTQKGVPKVYGGGIIVEGVRALGLEVTPENEKHYREEMREKHGKDYFIKKCIEQMKHLIDAGQHRIVFDGLYTWTEYKTLKHEFPGELYVVSIVTPKKLRYERMAKRSFRPLASHEVDQRDWAEIENLEKGGPIAIADHFIVNDGNLEKLHAQVDAELRSINFYD